MFYNIINNSNKFYSKYKNISKLFINQLQLSSSSRITQILKFSNYQYTLSSFFTSSSSLSPSTLISDQLV